MPGRRRAGGHASAWNVSQASSPAPAAATDYNMPGTNGLQLTAALRELIRKPDTVERLCDAVARAAHAQADIEGSNG